MTTSLNTITALLSHLTVDQLQIIETYTAFFYRQNLAGSIANLPNANLPSVGIFINAFANQLQFTMIPPPPTIENAVPQPFQRDLLPDLPLSPLILNESDFTSSRQQHPQLKSPEPEEPCECFNCCASRDCHEELTCPGCLTADPGQMSHMGPGGCCEHYDEE
jgi:hypothetical protein